MSEPKKERVKRAPIDQIEAAAKQAAVLTPLECAEFRETAVSQLGISFSDFDHEVERRRKEIRAVGSKRITLTDAGNGQRFVFRNSGVIRCCKQRTKGGWYFWNGQKWETDATGQAMELARLTAVDIAANAVSDYKNQKINGEEYASELAWSTESLDDRRLKAMLNQAGQGTSICISGDKFDAHPELFNVQNGTYNLNTGEFYLARREDLLTQVAGVTFDPAATCPKWETFLSEALSGAVIVVHYVQRSTGYLLTGSQSEQCFFLIQGGPGTGKSTFWRVVMKVWGEYFEMVQAGLFVKPPRFQKSNGENATPALAKLVGKRIAAEVELGEDDAFNSSLLKRISGGEALTVRMLYAPPFTFQPQAKPVFLTNHQPTTNDFSGGLQDRLRIIKFDVKFRGTPRENKNLYNELCTESSGILNWAIAGLRQMRERKGLDEPDVVKANVETYFQEENIVAVWLKERAEKCSAENGHVPKHLEQKLATFAQCFSDFKHWAERNEVEYGSSKWFSNRMKLLGHMTVVDRDKAKYYQFRLLFPDVYDTRNDEAA
jgi:putative DNA primase/helicase